MEARRLTLDQLVHERERLLFWLMAALSLIIYLLIGVTAFSDPATGGVILFYGLLLALLGFLVHGLALGKLCTGMTNTGLQVGPAR